MLGTMGTISFLFFLTWSLEQEKLLVTWQLDSLFCLLSSHLPIPVIRWLPQKQPFVQCDSVVTYDGFRGRRLTKISQLESLLSHCTLHLLTLSLRLDIIYCVQFKTYYSFSDSVFNCIVLIIVCLKFSVLYNVKAQVYKFNEICLLWPH